MDTRYRSMAMPSTHNDNADADAQISDRMVSSVAALARPIEAVAFWSAIALPFLYVPLLFNGLATTAQLTAFFVLLGLHAAAIVGGHRYNRE